MPTRLHALLVGVAVASGLALGGAAPAAAVATGAPADGPGAATQVIAVTRPAGDLTIHDLTFDAHGRFEVRVVDTRDRDPGWTVSITVTRGTTGPAVADEEATSSAPFADSDGRRYEQAVTVTTSGSTLVAAAPAHHGLGVARVSGRVLAEPAGTDLPLRVTITVI